MKSSYENGGVKAPDISALDTALKVKQFLNAKRSNNKIYMLQRIFDFSLKTL